MKVAIMTDTNSSITIEEGQRDGIFLMTLPVIIGEKTYIEGENLSTKELYQGMAEGVPVKSHIEKQILQNRLEQRLHSDILWMAWLYEFSSPNALHRYNHDSGYCKSYSSKNNLGSNVVPRYSKHFISNFDATKRRSPQKATKHCYKNHHWRP